MSSIDPTSSVTIGNMMPGLVSGLDTESMVEKLLSGTQSKIDKLLVEFITLKNALLKCSEGNLIQLTGCFEY